MSKNNDEKTNKIIKESKAKSFFRNKNIYSVVLLASLPATVSLIAFSFYAFGDSLIAVNFIRIPGMEENSGNIILSALFLSSFSVAFISGCTILVGIGTASRYSIAIGAGRYDQSQKIIGNGILLGFTLSVVVGISIIFWTPPLIAALATNITGGSESLAIVFQQADNYVEILGATMFLAVFAYLLPSLLRSEGHPIHSMIAILIGSAVNLGFDSIFIIALHLTLEGAAWATALGYVATTIYALLIFAFYKHKWILKGLISLKLKFNVYGRILAIGLGAFVRFIGGALTPLLLAVVTLTLLVPPEFNADPLFWTAVSGAILFYQTFLRRPAFGFIQGMRTVVGYFYGAQDKDKLWKAIKFSFFLILGVLLFFTIIALAIPRQLLAVYNINPAFLSYATPAFRIASISIFVIAPVFVTLEFYQGTNRFFKNIFISSLRGVTIFIPILFIMQAIAIRTGNTFLIWWAFFTTDFISFLIVIPFAIVDFRRLRNGSYFTRDKHLARLKL